MAGDICDCHRPQGSATGIRWVQARGAVKCPTTHKESLPQQRITRSKTSVVSLLTDFALCPYSAKSKQKTKHDQTSEEKLSQGRQRSRQTDKSNEEENNLQEEENAKKLYLIFTYNHEGIHLSAPNNGKVDDSEKTVP